MKPRVFSTLCALCIGLFVVLHIWVTAQRGYEAMGGEIFVLFAPIYIYGALIMRESD